MNDVFNMGKHVYWNKKITQKKLNGCRCHYFKPQLKAKNNNQPASKKSFCPYLLYYVYIMYYYSSTLVFKQHFTAGPSHKNLTTLKQYLQIIRLKSSWFAGSLCRISACKLKKTFTRCACKLKHYLKLETQLSANCLE